MTWETQNDCCTTVVDRVFGEQAREAESIEFRNDVHIPKDRWKSKLDAWTLVAQFVPKAQKTLISNSGSENLFGKADSKVKKKKNLQQRGFSNAHAFEY